MCIVHNDDRFTLKESKTCSHQSCTDKPRTYNIQCSVITNYYIMAFAIGHLRRKNTNIWILSIYIKNLSVLV